MIFGSKLVIVRHRPVCRKFANRTQLCGGLFSLSEKGKNFPSKYFAFSLFYGYLTSRAATKGKTGKTTVFLECSRVTLVTATVTAMTCVHLPKNKGGFPDPDLQESLSPFLFPFKIGTY